MTARSARKATMAHFWISTMFVIVAAVAQFTNACPRECQCFTDVPSVHCNTPDLDYVPRGIPGNATLLQMQGTKLTVLRKGDLKGLPLLTSLYLSDNQLKTVEVGAFDDTPVLKDVGLGSNQISELPSGIFRGLDKLEEVHLNQNSITVIPSGVLSSRPNLQVVDLQKNQIRKIQPGAFANLPKSDVFYFNNNNIKDIKDGVFQGPQGAKWLDFGNNNISSIEPTAFAALKNVTTLILDYNRISTLGSILHNLEQLDVVSLVNNELTVISDTDFTGCGVLRRVDLSGNRIADVAGKAFENLKNLAEIVLDNNKLTQMNVDLPVGLQTLYLQQNLLVEIPPLPPGVVDLDVSYSPIESIKSGQFSNLTKLQQLQLSGIKCFAQTGVINPYVFTGLGSVKLQTLALMDNQLSRVPTEALGQIDSLEILNLSGNNISAVSSKDFGHHTYLFQLDLSNNKLTSLPEQALMSLDIFQLDLSGNPLVYIGPDAFNHGLFHVGLESTKLRIIDGSAFNNSKGVKSLTLNSNSLTYLPEAIFAPLTFYGDPQEILQLDDNPWRCDCQMHDYAEWLHSPSAGNIWELRCVTPQGLRGKALRDVPLDQLTCACPQLTAPNISTEGSTTFVKAGQWAVLNCNVTCCPVAAVIWTTPSGANLSVDSGVPGMSVDEDGTLTIAAAMPEDAGTYICLAVNFLGQDQATVHLSVAGGP